MGARQVLAAHGIKHGGLQAAEAEIQPLVMEKGAWKSHGLRVALRGFTFHGRPAGKAETKDAGHLVEGLPRRVVDGGAKEFKLDSRFAMKQIRMAATHHQAHAGEDVPACRQPASVDVCFDVVHADQRYIERQGEHLRTAYAHQERPD